MTAPRFTRTLRRTARTLVAGAAFLTPLAVAANPASALTATGKLGIDTDLVKIAVDSGKADFGSGGHHFGAPDHSGEVIWFLDGNRVRAEVTGRVYWDDLFSGGCARVRVVFTFTDDSTETKDSARACRAGGFTGTVPSKAVDLVSSATKDVKKVRVTTRASTDTTSNGSLVGSKEEVLGVGAGSLETEGVRVGSGKADFGDGGHLFGSPTEDGLANFSLLDGVIRGSVSGLVYWDDLTSGGCARVQVRFTFVSGDIEVVDSPRVCRAGGQVKGAVPSKFVSISSVTDQHVVHIAVTTYASTGTTDVGTAVGSDTAVLNPILVNAG